MYLYIQIVMGVYNTLDHLSCDRVYYLIFSYKRVRNGHRQNYVAYFGKLDHVTDYI